MSKAWVWQLAFWLLLVAACEREPVTSAGPKSLPSLSSVPAAAVASASAPPAPIPESHPRCPQFPALPKWGHRSEDFTIALSSPVESRTVELRGKGVLMTFGYDEFLRAAECLNQKLVVSYLRSRPPTEQVVDISEQQERQFGAPAAALLDLGHVGITATGSKRAETIVKSFWTWMGCGGGCRHMGRDYRLRIPGYAFFEITDAMAHARGWPAATSGTTAP